MQLNRLIVQLIEYIGRYSFENMQRTLLLAYALVATVVAATRLSEPESFSETIFRPGFEYIYRYESQVFSGIRTVSNQIGGMKIRAQVRVQFTRGDGVLIKMDRVSIFKVNDVVSRLHEDVDVIPDSELTRITGEQEQIMVEHLIKPIKFRYEEGEIRDIRTVPSDKYWSINIKKGLVSMFQLKISGKSMPWSDTESSQDSSSYNPNSGWQNTPSYGSQKNIRNKLFETFNPIGSRRFSSSRLENAFKVMELDVNGECETKYVINTDSSFRSESSVSKMVVSKVKNFDNCLFKNSYEQGLFAHLSKYPSEKSLIQPSFEAEYILTGDRHHFLVKKATVEAKYFFKPYGPEGGQMSTHVTQKLSLESTSELQTPISAESYTPEKHGLKMEIPQASWLPSNSISGEYREEHQWKEVVENKLNRVINAIYPVMQESATAELFQLQLIIRHVPRRQLVSIIKSYLRTDSEEFNKKKEILLDILPTSINPETGKALLDLIRDGTINGIRARLSINAMVLTVKPTPEITKYLMSLYRESSTLERTTPSIRQTILLGVGTLCNKMINHMRRVYKPIPELTNAVEEVSQEFTSLLSEASTDFDKIRVLKAMGNMGAKELFTPIKTIIEDRSLSKSVRFEAVIALKKLAKPFDKLVHPVLLSVVMDQTESIRVRIAGVMVLKNSIPTYTTLQLLSHSLRSEQSTQFKSFVYTTFISLANLKNPMPELKETMKNARKVLKTMRAIPVGVFDSKDYVADFFSERLNMGATWNQEYIKSDRSGLPHSFISKMSSTIFGNQFKLAKIGVEGEMVTSILRRLVGPNGLLKDIVKNKASVLDLFNPLSRSEMTVQWPEYLKKKSFSSVSEDEVHGYAFGGLFGYELFYHKFDKETVESLTNYVMRRAPEYINRLREGITFNTLKTFSVACNSIVLPTPMGIPLSLNMSANAIFKLDGYVKATSMPSFVDFISRRPFMTKKFEIETNLKPSWSKEVFGYMGVDLKWMRTGVALKGHTMGKFPLKGAIIVDPVSSKLTVKMEPPTESIKAFNAKVEPFTFVYYVPRDINNLPFKYELKSLKTSDTVVSKKYENTYGCQVTGLEWHLKSHWTKCVHTWCPYYPLTGKQEVSLIIQSPSTTPKEIEFEVQIKKFSQELYNEYDNEELTTGRNSGKNYRTESRSTIDESYDSEFSRVFDNVEVDRMISSPRKIEVFAEVTLNGYRSVKVFKGKLTWLAENNYLEHQFNAQFVAVPNSDMEQFKFKLNSVWKCPLISAYGSESEYDTTSDFGKVDIHWGRTGFSEKNIKCRFFELEESTWTSEFRSEGIDYNNHYLENAGLTSKPFQYGFEAVFPQMTPVWQMYLTKVHDLIKYGFYNYLKTGIPENIPLNKLVIYGQYFSKIDKLSLIVKTPRETNFLLDMPFRNPMSHYYTASLHDLNPSYVYRNFSEQFDMDRFDETSFDKYHSYRDYTPSLRGICKIYSDKLMSFDGTPIMLPLHERESSGSRCDVLFARDCSERSQFAVTGSFRNRNWMVKLVVPSYNIEVVPEWSSDRAEVKINGENIRLRFDIPVKLYREPSNPSSELIVSIEKTGDVFHVKLHELGVFVTVEQNNKISIKVSPVSIFHGRLCGLCGNNNYDLGDDMTTFDGKLTNSRSFVMDNVMPSEYCSADDYSTQLGVRHTEYSKIKKTLKTEKMENGEEMTCFSTSPVTMCRSHCTAESTSSRNVRFVCLPTENSTVERLTNKYESGYTDLTEELSSFGNNFYEYSMEVPERCSTTY